MKRPTSSWRSASPYDPFLFAQAGMDIHGVEISTLSALARLDLDPWVEATTLALMPVETATARMAERLAAVPDWSADQRDCRDVAAELVAMLPSPARVKSHAARPDQNASPELATKTYSRGFVILVLIGLALGVQWLASAERHPAEATSSVDGKPGFAFDIPAKPSPFADPH